MTTENKKEFIINILFISLIISILYITLKYLLKWLLPFILAFILAKIIQKPIHLLARKTKINKKIWSIVIMFFTLILFFALVSAIVYAIGNEVVSLVLTLPSKFEELAPAVTENINSWIEKISLKIPEELKSAYDGAIDQAYITILEWLTSFSGKIITYTASMASLVPNLVVAIVALIVASFYTSNEYQKVKLFFKGLLPKENRIKYWDAFEEFGKKIKKILSSCVIIMTITGCELFIGFTLIGQKNALPLSLIICTLDILPIIGTGTFLGPWGIIAILTGNTIKGIEILALYLIITLIRNFIEPKLIGDRIGLNPLVTLIAMYIGMKIMGIIGALVLPLILIFILDMRDAGVLVFIKDNKR